MTEVSPLGLIRFLVDENIILIESYDEQLHMEAILGMRFEEA